jgi:type II secretory pathway pseudopilin PulG
MTSGKAEQLRMFVKQMNGFAYVMLLVTVAILSVFAAGSLQLGSQLSRQHAEQALLDVGLEFQRALYSYAGAKVTVSVGSGNAAANLAKGPRTIEELLRDSRTASVKRHLRQIYADPMTGGTQWGVVKDPAGFILGVYSKSSERPIKQTNFDLLQAHFEDAESYSKWIFGLPSAQHVAKTNVSTSP